MSLALGAALYHDFAFFEDTGPLAVFLETLFPDASEVVQFTISLKSPDKARPPAVYRPVELLAAVREGSLHTLRVGTSPHTRDADQIEVGAHVSPPAHVSAEARTRGWRYRVDLRVGSNAVASIGAERIVSAIVTLANEVSPHAGVVFPARTATFAGALASGAGVGALTPAEDRQVREVYYAVHELHGRIRGPEWGTFLAPEHVSQLGGLERVENEAGCARFVGLRGGGAYLQLTNDPLRPGDPTHDELRVRLSRFLTPVL